MNDMSNFERLLMRLRYALMNFTQEDQLEIVESVEAIAIVECEEKLDKEVKVCQETSSTIQ